MSARLFRGSGERTLAQSSECSTDSSGRVTITVLAAYNEYVHRALATVSLVFCAGLVAGCGGSSIQTIAHAQAKYFGDPNAAITRIETVRLVGALPGHRRWTMIQMKGRHAFRVGCPRSGPAPPGPCAAHYLEVGVDLANHGKVMYWGLTASEVSAIARARRASPRFRIFPDAMGLYLRCAIPRGGTQLPPDRPLTGICSTEVAPNNHVRRVAFIETWGGGIGANTAGWIVTLSRSGRVQSVRVTGQPPQLWR